MNLVITQRPFHETIVDAICEAIPDEIPLLLKLIIRTEIPKNHDKIIKAMKRWELPDGYYVGVKEAKQLLINQKQIAKTKTENTK